jgi:hypothetical protein
MPWIISRLKHFASLQWGRWVYVCVLLSGVLRNEYVGMIYCFSGLIVEWNKPEEGSLA